MNGEVSPEIQSDEHAPSFERGPSTSRETGSREQAKRTRTESCLARFDVLPDDALVDIEVVCALRSRSPASTWRDVKAGRLPPPIHIGKSARWRVGGLRKASRGN